MTSREVLLKSYSDILAVPASLLCLSTFGEFHQPTAQTRPKLEEQWAQMKNLLQGK